MFGNEYVLAVLGTAALTLAALALAGSLLVARWRKRRSDGS